MRLGQHSTTIACMAYLGFGLAFAAGAPSWLSMTSGQAVGAGMAAALTLVFAHLLVVGQRDRAAERRRTRRITLALPRLEDRLDQIDANLEALANDVRAAQHRQIADLATELALLRTVVERFVVEARPVEDEADGPPASADAMSMAVLTSPRRGHNRRGDVLPVLEHALEESRVDLYLQPVVRLPSRKVAHYETFSRVRDAAGTVIGPDDYLKAAEEAGLAGALDNLLLFRCVNLIRKLGPRRPGVRLFCNMSNAALEDPGFLAELIGFMRAHPDLADRLVFEIAAADWAALTQETRVQLGVLARFGFAFSIDQVTHLEALEPARLAALNVHYVKVEAQVLLHGRCPIEREELKDFLGRYDIELIATHIEDERTVVEILDLGIAYGQGYLFGGPKPSRGDVNGGPDARAA